MNVQLLNPFAQDIPDSVSSTLDNADCSVCRFNRGYSALHGHYLAVGRTDGLITIWDIETKTILRVLEGHVKSITNVSWSSCNRYLCSSSLDWNVIVWDLSVKNAIISDGIGTFQGGERKKTIRFDLPVVSVEFAYGNSNQLLVILQTQQAFLIDLSQQVRLVRRRTRTSKKTKLDHSNGIIFDPDISSETKQQDQLVAQDVRSSPKRFELIPPSSSFDASDLRTKSSGITAARFSPDGERIFAGTSQGTILIFDAKSAEFLVEHKVLGTSSGVKEIAFDPSGKHLVVNTNDRAIRILNVITSINSNSDQQEQQPATKKRKMTVELVVLHKYQDLVNRTAWNGIGFSGDSDFVFGGAAHKAAHNIYIWDRSAGTLVKILEGPKDSLIHVDWHPNRRMIASVSNTGSIYIWFSPAEEIWSAYAPGFEELEENVEYQEREDEFDLEDENEVTRRKQDEEEARVDLVGTGPSNRTFSIQDSTSKQAIDQLLQQYQGDNIDTFQCLVQSRLGELVSDSGWQPVDQDSGDRITRQGDDSTTIENHGNTTNGTEANEKEYEERSMVFSILDDDRDEAFVIQPRLEEEDIYNLQENHYV